jgi:hypothetical protein
VRAHLANIRKLRAQKKKTESKQKGAMPRGKVKDRDGIYQRKDRPGWWASWVDASGKRRQRKLEAHTLQQARTLLNAEKASVEKTVTLGYAPPQQKRLKRSPSDS